METNICAYPTSKAEDLSDSHIKDRVIEGEALFIMLLKECEPSLLILHNQLPFWGFIPEEGREVMLS
jgi:hypothetical protein